MNINLLNKKINLRKNELDILNKKINEIETYFKNTKIDDVEIKTIIKMKKKLELYMKNQKKILLKLEKYNKKILLIQKENNKTNAIPDGALNSNSTNIFTYFFKLF